LRLWAPAATRIHRNFKEQSSINTNLNLAEGENISSMSHSLRTLQLIVPTYFNNALAQEACSGYSVDTNCPN